MLLDILTFFGHLHPLVVHLPLGFLLLAGIFQFISYRNKNADLHKAISITLLLGCVAAVLACIFGYILSLSGEYERQILRHHKWSGIALAIVAGALYLMHTKRMLVQPAVMLTGMFAMTALMLYAGHNGGALTHGSDYLTLQTLTYSKRPKPASINET